MTRGVGETSCRGGAAGMPGELIDMGVLGGRGIACRGARGESGMAPGNAVIPRGETGGDIMED